MNNERLRAETTQCVYRIRALARLHANEQSRHLQAIIDGGGGQIEDSAFVVVQDVWKRTEWPKAQSLRQELRRRIYGEGPYPEGSPVIDAGMLAGANPLENAASELTVLARSLP